MISIWLQAIRPKTLVSSFFPALAGIFLAANIGEFNLLIAAATLGCALSLQILTNISNDYFDFQKGADNSERVGPLRVTSAGLVTPTQMKQAILINVSISFLLGVYLVIQGGFPILLIGLLSIAFAILYTTGPFPLAYIGLGDIFAFIFFGPVACAGSFYLQTQYWSYSSLAAGSLFGLLAVCLLNSNNIRDYEQDKKANKKTLVVRFGISFGKKLYTICISLSLILLPFFVSIKWLPVGALVALVSAAVAIPILKTLRHLKRDNIINLLVLTAKYYVVYGLLLCVGLVASIYF